MRCMTMKLPKLSLRDLFWLVLVCALALGWWLDRERLIDSNLRSNAKYRTTIQTLQDMARAAGWSVEINHDTGEILGAAHPGH
jgi:hypothetical protein